ncbi:hypothetical protein GCM10011367_23210 [Marinicauda pacifica]|jgi:hypothetical protein|nr:MULTISPECIES: hypothetical protein [Marinicauda]GGE47759.1 hypothetical protein GCM10011367_23210 [Marinicauda pacifica]
MTGGLKGWFEDLNAKERSAVLTLGAFLSAVLLFAAGIQFGRALSVLV